MALKGDETGSVALGTRVATGDFSVLFSSVTLTDPVNPEIIIGDSSSANSYLAIFTGAIMSGRAAGTTIAPGYDGVSGESIKIEMFRIGGTGGLRVNNVLLNNAVGVGAVTLDSLFSFNGGSLIGGMLLSGTLSMTGFSGGDSLYNFEGSGTTLVDSISGVDGTLSGFTTGGFTEVVNGISIESVVEGQPRQRDENNQAVFPIGGPLTGEAPTTISYSFDEVNWSVLDSSPDPTSYLGSVTVTGEQIVYVRRDDDTDVTDSILLKAAPCIGIAPAQSNGVSTIINAQPITIGAGKPTPVMYKNGTFSDLADPTGINLSPGSLGSLWPYIAEKYSDLGIPICLGNVALSSSTIASWDPALANYAKLVEFAADCGGLEYVISIIGETDSFNGTSKTAFKAAFLTTAQYTFDTYGAKTHVVYFPVGLNTGTTPNVNTIREAYDELIAENDFIVFAGDLAVINISSASNPLNDDLHIRLDPDATIASEIIWNELPKPSKPEVILNLLKPIITPMIMPIISKN